LTKSIPSKLFKLKKWLTLPETARHLSGVYGGEVTEADILQLALDGYLTLSVSFVNCAYVRPGKVVHFDDEKLANFVSQGIYPSELDWAAGLFSDEPLLLNLRIDEGKYLKIEKKVVRIEGIWDLPMIGGEAIYVESKYHELTNGLSISVENFPPVSVEKFPHD
jgi:hypothetical protein